jgi:lipopolysaccharide biosynthesis protein
MPLYLARLRHTVRLRTRLRAWGVLRTRPQLTPIGSPADFGAWTERAPGRKFGAFPDAWKDRPDLPLGTPANVGVVLHAFYSELLSELFERLRRIPIEYDLWITNATGRPLELPDEIGRVLNVRVLDVQNRGRDILPLAQLVNAGHLDPYFVILKLHTKRSEWRARHEAFAGEGAGWRHDLLDAVLGTADDIATILSAFVEQPDLGLVTSDQSVLGRQFWGDNQPIVANLLRRMELELDPRGLRFAAGSIYWARGFVLQGMRALNLSDDDFEPEIGQVNATTAHAVERALGMLIEEAGLSLVGRSGLTAPSNSESYRRLEARSFPPRARLVAFYLPQFHPIPENDKWWGEGFTEWRNVAAAQPVYQGHHQPRLPWDLGFYDLRLDDVRRSQLSLATAAGIEGFMYYYYWFAGQRLLDAPLQALLKSDIPQPFCIMWANENWTRRWDGRESDVLIAQDYERVPADHFINDILPYLFDERYMTVDGRKIVAIYRPAQFGDVARVVENWRERAREADVGELFVVNVEVLAEFHGIRGSPAQYGLDGSLSFPPHNYPWQWLGHGGLGVDPRFRGNILSYQALAEVAERRLRSRPSATSFPGVMVAFDNTARRQWAPDVWYGSNPYTFRRWLATAVSSVQDRESDDRLVFVNAWNEWAESAVLEPTDRFGRTFLLAVRDVAFA